MKKEMRVWWSSRVPIKNSLETYPVKTIKEARKKIEELTNRDLADKSITDNVGGLEIFDFDTYEKKWSWSEWYCDDCGEDIMDCECGGNK